MSLWRRGCFALLACLAIRASADDTTVTHQYWLKNTDATAMIQALNIVIRNPAGRRIMGGQGKHLVVTDLPEQQSQIAEIIPVMDQTTIQTKPQRIVMEMVGRAGIYMHDNQKTAAISRKIETPGGSPTPSAAFASGVNSFDTFKSSGSIYAEEDAKFARQPRRIVDESVFPSFTELILKGIFETAPNKRIALISSGGILYTARDGGLFESNRSRLKGVTSQVFADQVIVVGPDRISRKITFKSTL